MFVKVSSGVGAGIVLAPGTSSSLVALAALAGGLGAGVLLYAFAWKGGVTGPVATKFIPPPDLTNAELQRQRTDGYWHSYIMAGGAVMPAYGEAMSYVEAWHVVNYLRTLGSVTQ